MSSCNQYRNYMDELLAIINEIECLKPEPEICNVSCPPLGCPRGPCPGLCCHEGVCDPCAISKMPCRPPCPQPRPCRPPPFCCPKAYGICTPQSARCPPKSCYTACSPPTNYCTPEQTSFCIVPICPTPYCPVKPPRNSLCL